MNSTLVYKNQRDQYYIYDDELYCLTFPEEWATNHAPNTGPNECDMCKHLGSWNGVFIGYCVECAEVYEFNRGVGFVEIGKQNTYEHYYMQQKQQKNKKIPTPISITINKNTFVEKNAFNTYLKNINPDDVGDKELCDSAILVNVEYDKQQKYPTLLLDKQEEKLVYILRHILQKD